MTEGKLKVSCDMKCQLPVLNGSCVFPVRDRTISPADLQGILGMMAHDQRTGARGMPSFPAGLFSPRMPSQGPRVLVLTLFVIFKKISNNRELK